MKHFGIHFFLALLLLPNFAYSAQSNMDRGWWVVLANFRTCEMNACGSEIHVQQVSSKAARCGLSVYNDFSDKFVGFRGGYDAYVVRGAFSKSKAQIILAQAKPCFPAAYIKYARYMGE
jgi:hypothetical protein